MFECNTLYIVIHSLKNLTQKTMNVELYVSRGIHKKETLNSLWKTNTEQPPTQLRKNREGVQVGGRPFLPLQLSPTIYTQIF